jgi:hypothetical protein
MIGTQRHDSSKALLHALFTKRDFAEAIQAEMFKEVLGDHFGKISKMILEGSCKQFFSATLGKFTKEFMHICLMMQSRVSAMWYKNMYTLT